MKIGSRLALQISIFIFIATTALLLLINFQLKRYAITLAEEKANLILVERQATIDYVIKNLRPPLFKLLKENEIPSSYFDPSWMSAGYINRIIMKYVNNTDFSDIYYKNAAINARSPENEADSIEKDFLQYAHNENEMVTKSGVFDFNGKPYFIYLKTNTSRFAKGCMKCHSTPDIAPSDLIKLYGKDRSFGKNVGDIASVLSLRIPLEIIHSNINSLTINLFIAICGFSGLFFLLQWLLSNRIIVLPLRKITAKAVAITNDDSLLGEEIIINNRGELSELAQAFSDMSKRLAANKGNLETLVTKRTKELSKTNVNLNQEIEKRIKKENELKSIFRAAPIGIGVVCDRVLSEVNDHFCDMIGYEKNELLGQNARILYFSDNDYKYVGKEKYRQIEEKGTGTVEIRFKKKDGKSIDVLMSSTPLDQNNLSAGVTFTALDITDRKQNERDTQTLVQSTVGIIGQELFDTTVVKLCEWLQCDCAIIGKIVKNGTVEAISMMMDDAPVKNYSYPLKGSPCDETTRKCYCEYPVNVCELFPDDQDLVKMNAKGYVGAVLKNQKGMTIGILCAISRNKIQTSQQTQKIMKIIAARVSAEIERKTLEMTKDKLEIQLRQTQKLESIGTLAGGIAHDFNNILFPILGHSEMLLQDISDGNHSKASVREIYSGALRAKELVQQILTFSRQEKTEMKLMKLQPILTEALKMIRSTIPTTINILQDIESKCGAVKADPTQIHQIIMNLTTNAYHAMEENGGVMEIQLRQIELGKLDLFNSKMVPGTYACLTIKDTGMGMAKELTANIFDPFFTTKEKDKGTGMGLSVVHGIVNRMKGAIQVYSEPGKGSVFHVYLPIEKSVFDNNDIYPEAKIQGGKEQILLVDDEKAILIMEKQMLERLGYQVSSRISSIEALEAFRDNPDEFDLVITDMAMPNLPGDKFAMELTKINPDIPILLCTGFSESMSEEKAASLGIKGFLFKPTVMKDLARKIREVLDK